MTTMTSILAWVGGLLALAAPLFGWLVKRYIDNAVQLRFDKLKAEHGVKFAWQHEQVTKVATEIHQLLVEARNTLGYVAGSGFKIDMGPTDSDVEHLTDAAAKLNLAFARNSMFLPKAVREQVAKAAGLLMFAHNAVLQAKMFLDAKENEPMTKAMANAFQLLHHEIDPTVSKLEGDFRALLLGEEWGE